MIFDISFSVLSELYIFLSAMSDPNTKIVLVMFLNPLFIRIVYPYCSPKAFYFMNVLVYFFTSVSCE